MATKLRAIRLDDDVWAEIVKLRQVYGTDNAGMRAKFGLSGDLAAQTAEAQLQGSPGAKPVAGKKK